MFQASSDKPFENCLTLADVYVVLDEMKQKGQGIDSKSIGTISAEYLAREVYIATRLLKRHAQTAKAEGRVITPDEVSSLLSHLPRGKELQHTIRQICVPQAHVLDSMYLPRRLAADVMGQELEEEIEKTEFRLSEFEQLEYTQSTYEDVDSISDVLARVAESRIVIGAAGVNFKSNKIAEQIRTYWDKVVNSHVMDGRKKYIESSAVKRAVDSLSHFLPANQAFPEVFNRLFQLRPEREEREIFRPGEVAFADASPHTRMLGQSQPRLSEAKTRLLPRAGRPSRDDARVIARVPSARGADRAERKKPQSSGEGPQMSRRWLLGAGLGAAGLVTCGGVTGGGIGLLQRVADGLGDNATGDAKDTGLTIPEGWFELSPEQFAEVQESIDWANNHHLKYARYLMRNSKRGVTKSGRITGEPHDLSESLGAVVTDLDNMFDFHERDGNRILGMDEGYHTEEHDGKEHEVTAVARMRHNDTPDNITDDVMAFNVRFLGTGVREFSATPWHEVGHKYMGGQEHDDALTFMSRNSAEFTQAILDTGDFSFYLTFMIDSAEYAVEMYLKFICQDIEQMLESGQPIDIEKMKQDYTKTEAELPGWARRVADLYFHNYDAFEPFGITQRTVEQALIAGKMHEVANERVRELLEGKHPEIGYETAQEFIQEENLDWNFTEPRERQEGKRRNRR